MARSNQFAVTLTIAGRDLGQWDEVEGGGVGSSDTTFRPGGMRPRIALGGSKETDSLTLRRLYDDDLAGNEGFLYEQVGKPGNAVAVRQRLDANERPSGRPITYRGNLTTATPPDNSGEDDDPALFEVELTIGGPPVIA